MRKKKNKAIIIFAKHPENGKVKTRLAKTLGNDFAVEFYKVCSEYIFEMIEKLKGEIEIYLFYSGNNFNLLKNWINKDFNFFKQEGSHLGEKMFNAFQQSFNEGSDKVLIIGTDIPDIDEKIIQEAFEELEGNDVVVGPCPDGGYYLLGLKRPYDFLFENIEWSSETVLSKTIYKAEAANLKIKLLDELIDIDTQEDLKNWLEKSNEENISLKSQIGDLLKDD
jgi:rSAM/selenodomain-associated transferase 1